MAKFNITGTIKSDDDLWAVQSALRDLGFETTADNFEIEEVSEDVYWFTYNVAIKAASAEEAESLLSDFISAQPENVWENASSVILDSDDPRASYPITAEDI